MTVSELVQLQLKLQNRLLFDRWINFLAALTYSHGVVCICWLCLCWLICITTHLCIVSQAVHSCVWQGWRWRLFGLHACSQAGTCARPDKCCRHAAYDEKSMVHSSHLGAAAQRSSYTSACKALASSTWLCSCLDKPTDAAWKRQGASWSLVQAAIAALLGSLFHNLLQHACSMLQQHHSGLGLHSRSDRPLSVALTTTLLLNSNIRNQWQQQCLPEYVWPDAATQTCNWHDIMHVQCACIDAYLSDSCQKPDLPWTLPHACMNHRISFDYCLTPSGMQHWPAESIASKARLSYSDVPVHWQRCTVTSLIRTLVVRTFLM